jgi:putative nucleotidyltransferase with HDIG domain
VESKVAPAEALNARLRSERRAFEQRLFLLDDDDFDALIATRFGRGQEQAVTALIEQAYNSPVATSRDELSQVGSQGIVVRILGSQGEQVSAVVPPVINDVAEAKAELDRLASAPASPLPDFPPNVRRAILHLAKRQIRPNLTVNLAETENRRLHAAAAVKDAVIQIKRGQRVIGDGELINPSHLVILRAMRAQTDQLDRFRTHLGGSGLIALLIAAAYGFHRAAFRRFRPTRKDALLLGMVLLGMLGLIQLWVAVADAVHDKYPRIPVEALYYLVPVAAGGMLARFILSAEVALFFTVVLACLSGIMLGNSLSFGVYSLITSLVAAQRIPRARNRAGIFKAGAVTGIVGLFTVIAFGLAEGKGIPPEWILTAVCSFIGNALAVPVLVVALTPLIEATFGYASDIKLLELANLNHPALKELIVQAPGTYHHSIIVGSLVEGAAEAIGANPLLARSCAYYHDLGKGRNPLYFGENQKGENRHDNLAPAMSAMIVKRHVTDGLELARQYKLPKLVLDAVPQHHGTRLVGYFYQKALKEFEGKEGGAPQIEESLYRYPGPKPQFREAALVMIADAVEAASRAMPEPTTAKFQAMVQKIINVIFSEGQLEECDLTLKDLNLIAQSFVRTLEGIYHARPLYPPAGADPNRPVTALGETHRAAGLTLAGTGESWPEIKRNAGQS